MDDFRLTVAICTYNRSELLRDTLTSFREQEGLDALSYEVVVVDNNSTDDTPEVVRQFASWPNLRYVTEEKQGLSNARNRGIEEARGEIIAYTDDDVLFSRRWLAELLEGIDRYPEADVFGGKISVKWESAKPDWFVDEGDYSMRGVVGHFEPDGEEGITTIPPFGGNMAFRASVLRASGGFSPERGREGEYLGSGEETELVERLWAEGSKVAYLPDALVHHRIHHTRTLKPYYVRWFTGWQRTATHVLWKKQGKPGSPRQLLWRNKHYVRWMLKAAASWLWLAITCQWSAMFSRQLKMLSCWVQLSLETKAFLGRGQ